MSTSSCNFESTGLFKVADAIICDNYWFILIFSNFVKSGNNWWYKIWSKSINMNKLMHINLPLLIKSSRNKLWKSASFNISSLLQLIKICFELHKSLHCLNICSETTDSHKCSVIYFKYSLEISINSQKLGWESCICCNGYAIFSSHSDHWVSIVAVNTLHW